MGKDFGFVTKIKSVIHEVHSLHNINKMITWKHRQLDTDNDSLLGPNEIQHVVMELNQMSSLCGEYLLERCNTNHDIYITRKEWRLCFGFNKEGLIDNVNLMSGYFSYCI